MILENFPCHLDSYLVGRKWSRGHQMGGLHNLLLVKTTGCHSLVALEAVKAITTK